MFNKDENLIIKHSLNIYKRNIEEIEDKVYGEYDNVFEARKDEKLIKCENKIKEIDSIIKMINTYENNNMLKLFKRAFKRKLLKLCIKWLT